MRIRKEAEFNAAILHFLAKCVAQGDDQTLAYLGLDRTDAAAIESLHLTDIDHLGSVHFPLLRKASIDRDLVHRLIERVRASRQSTSLRNELLTLDAPFPLMQALFGMDASEYAERGWRLQIRRQSGRPAEPSEDEQAAVWQAYEALQKPEDHALNPEDYLILCKTTGLSARTVWSAMQ
ncbi:MAG: STY4526/YPO1902 family pathogenicity island replication protein, partial [Gammaproteobacteria bacterium]